MAQNSFYQKNPYRDFNYYQPEDRFVPFIEFFEKNSLSGQRGKTLEVGSGLGVLAENLYYRGHHIIGSDVYPQVSAAYFLKKNLPIQSKKIDICTQQIDQSLKVDNIIMHQVFEHLDDPDLAIKNCHKLLNPGGRVFINSPNLISILSNLNIIYQNASGRWETPLIYRKDGYSFPFGDTLVQNFMVLITNIYRNAIRFLWPRYFKIIRRVPCQKIPALSDSDATHLSNPHDLCHLLAQHGFKIIKNHNKKGLLKRGTWAVAEKR